MITQSELRLFSNNDIFQTSSDAVNDANCDSDSSSNDFDEYLSVNSPLDFCVDDNGTTVVDFSPDLEVPYLPSSSLLPSTASATIWLPSVSYSRCSASRS